MFYPGGWGGGSALLFCEVLVSFADFKNLNFKTLKDSKSQIFVPKRSDEIPEYLYSGVQAKQQTREQIMITIF